MHLFQIKISILNVEEEKVVYYLFLDKNNFVTDLINHYMQTIVTLYLIVINIIIIQKKYL